MHNLSTAAAMFELGASLRAARHKRGLELDAVQRELRIRKRYLEALEGERFELLPGQVSARGFLREYAEFLGLDGSLYLDEYNPRFARHDEQPTAARPTLPAANVRRGRHQPPGLARRQGPERDPVHDRQPRHWGVASPRSLPARPRARRPRARRAGRTPARRA